MSAGKLLFTIECAGEEHKPENSFRELIYLLVVGNRGIYSPWDSGSTFLWPCIIDHTKILEDTSFAFSGVMEWEWG